MSEEIQVYYRDKKQWVKMLLINDTWYIYWPCGTNEAHSVGTRHVQHNEGSGTYSMPKSIRCTKCGWKVHLSYNTLENC